MPAFILNDMGDSEAALILLGGIMESKPDMADDERAILSEAIERLNQEMSGETQ